MSDEQERAEVDRIRERVLTAVRIERENVGLRADVARHERTIMTYADEIARLTADTVALRAENERLEAEAAGLLAKLRAAERVIAAARHMLAAWNGEGETVADWGEFERVVEAYDQSTDGGQRGASN